MCESQEARGADSINFHAKSKYAFVKSESRVAEPKPPKRKFLPNLATVKENDWGPIVCVCVCGGAKGLYSSRVFCMSGKLGICRTLANGVGVLMDFIILKLITAHISRKQRIFIWTQRYQVNENRGMVRPREVRNRFRHELQQWAGGMNPHPITLKEVIDINVTLEKTPKGESLKGNAI